jgi:hypothetical protein
LTLGNLPLAAFAARFSSFTVIDVLAKIESPVS